MFLSSYIRLHENERDQNFLLRETYCEIALKC